MEELNLGYMGTMLKAARLDAKLTQDEVAERIGITLTSWQLKTRANALRWRCGFA